MGLVCPSTEGFLMTRKQNVWGKATYNFGRVHIWQIAQTLMRRRVLRRIIWIYAICKYSLCGIICINAFTTSPQLRTLNFRQATPLIDELFHISIQTTNFRNVSIHGFDSLYTALEIMMQPNVRTHCSVWSVRI